MIKGVGDIFGGELGPSDNDGENDKSLSDEDFGRRHGPIPLERRRSKLIDHPRKDAASSPVDS